LALDVYDQLKVALDDRLHHWIVEFEKRRGPLRGIVERQAWLSADGAFPGEAHQLPPTGDASPTCKELDLIAFPKRAQWLRHQLSARRWNKYHLQAAGGPHHKTTQKVLDGVDVREDTLEKIRKGLSTKCVAGELLDIPQC
jgi:hypothetical protein